MSAFSASQHSTVKWMLGRPEDALNSNKGSRTEVELEENGTMAAENPGKAI